MEDKAIVQLYLDRKEEAITESKNKYGTKLLGISKQILMDMESAKECENDTYLQAWNLIPPNNPATYLFTFLARIIRHKSLDICRGRATQKRKSIVVELSIELEQCISGGPEVEDAILAEELGKAISTFLGTQPKVHRQIFVRRYFYMDSVETMAKTFGCSESKIKSILFRMRGKLKIYLEKEGYAL